MDGTTTSTGWLGQVTLEKSFERDHIQIDYSRTVSPSARGAQSQRDEYDFSVRHRFSELWNGQIKFRYLQNQTQQASGFGGSSLNRDFGRAELSFFYRLTEYLSLVGAYKYTFQEYQTSAASTDDHSISLTLSYSGNKFIKSR